MNKEPTREINSPTLELYPSTAFPQSERSTWINHRPYIAINTAYRCIIGRPLLKLIGEDPQILPEIQGARFLGVSFDPGTLELYLFPAVPNLARLRLHKNGVSNPYINLKTLFKEKNLIVPKNVFIYKDRNYEVVTLPVSQDGSIKTTALKMRIPEAFLSTPQVSDTASGQTMLKNFDQSIIANEE